MAITIIEVLVLILTYWVTAENDIDGRVIEMLSNDNYDYYLSQDDQYEFSTDHNIILILTDEYDSFCFEKAVKMTRRLRRALRISPFTATPSEYSAVPRRP